jgi:hypothetical protein
MKLSKIDVAEAQICAAVRMFFEGGHPVPIYTLANAAREIVSSIGAQADIETVQRELADKRGVKLKEWIKPLTGPANFFKHADRDASATLEFDENEVEVMLQLACHDFGRIAGAVLVEALIYELWITAIAIRRVSKQPLHLQELIRRAIKFFPGIRSADRPEQKRIGLAVLRDALANPTRQMEIRRQVNFPERT